MCGIIGAVLVEGVVSDLLLNGLKRLEYRGYDSVGVATVSGDQIHLKKDKGRIDEVHATLDLSAFPGSIGIGHTRWATHGLPARINAHPHTDCNNTIALVHNGIIENFLHLREVLKKRGHTFTSNTDTEIVAHLIEERLKEGCLFPAAVMRALRHVKGSFALTIVSADHPNTLIGVRKESPLVIGVSENGKFIASDAVAFIDYTRKVVYLHDWQMAVLEPHSLQVYDIKEGMPVDHEVQTIDWTSRQINKAGFKHHMLKEIYEQPYAIADALRTSLKYVEKFVDHIYTAENLFFVACGTSYHASLYASYIFPRIVKINAAAVIASEFSRQYESTLGESDVVIAISQSGETADTLEAVRSAKEEGARVLGVVNAMGSALTRISDSYIGQNSGPEIGVAATKTYTSQLAILSRLAIYAGIKNHNLSIMEGKRLLRKLHRVSYLVNLYIKRFNEEIEKITPDLCDKNSFCFLGRDVNYPTAAEAMLKMLEITYKPALAYPSGESKHGFLSMVEKGYPVIIFTPTDEAYEENLNTIMEMKARQGEVIAITDKQGKEAMRLSDRYIITPKTHPIFTPIVNAIPAQLLAYHTSVNLGLDPDFPRNLAKSVTVK
ncbi:MAG: glutamine--fructose-6-phosphate transaminase (isomerizing) [Nitrososphaeria archaeon]|nr:glutamine--fructose-6-phosphate transaminase (isomerizing) [Nitrososphaeria archaeon]NIQ32242.1 glutamine--fructose-6-phosphate transaminase (isomerizing) [Nitrososphaeria archaeon]